uniref:Uncharacterized protein n=1 Tax=Anguilla anguilla TaxID=7936 RepID=A0A0E9TRG1_ANGAN
MDQVDVILSHQSDRNTMTSCSGSSPNL